MHDKISKIYAYPLIILLIADIYFAATHFSYDNFVLIVLGFMFSALPLIMIFTDNLNNKSDSKNMKILKTKLLGIFFGLVFSVIGIAFIYIIYHKLFLIFVYKRANIISALPFIVAVSIMAALPILFVFIGVHLFFTSLFHRLKPRIVKLKVIRVTRDENDNTYTILFIDESIDQVPDNVVDETDAKIQVATKKQYIYTTENGEKFCENGIYEVDVFKYGDAFGSCIILDDFTMADALEQFNDEDFIRK